MMSLYSCSTSSRFLEIESEFSIFVLNYSLIFPDSLFLSFDSISLCVSLFGDDLFSDFLPSFLFVRLNQFNLLSLG